MDMPFCAEIREAWGRMFEQYQEEVYGIQTVLP
jgi:hypothetical protein